MEKVLLAVLFVVSFSALNGSNQQVEGEINVGSNTLDVFIPVPGPAELQTKDCSSGLKSIGAGWQSLDPVETRLIDSKPFDETSWKLKFFTGSPGGSGVRIHTVCAEDVVVQNLSNEIILSTSGLLQVSPPQCPSGFKIVSAGWEGLDKDKTQLHESKPVDQTTWSLGFLHDGSGDTVTVHSVCVLPITVQVVTENVNIDTIQDNMGLDMPQCPSGFKIAGAGWEGHDPDQTRMHESRPTGSSGWNLEFRFANPGGDSFTVHSICIDLFIPDDEEIIGGEIIPIETTILILAGAQTFSWMIPVVLSILGIGLFVVSRKSE